MIGFRTDPRMREASGPAPFLIALLVAACVAGPASAKTLVFCSEGNPESLNPQIVTTSTGINAGRPMFNTLVEFSPGSTSVVPGLAESWTISDDGQDYTFRLRRGVQFHSNASFRPTREMNADDVLFSLNRQWKEDHPYHRVSGSRYDYFHDLGMRDLLSEIEKVDDRTVRIRLTRPDAVFLSNMAMPFNVILSAEYAEALLRAGTPSRLDLEPIGTGPFAFASFQRNVAIRYNAFRDYWGGEIAIGSLVFSITPNPAVRLTKLKAGECHVMAFPSPADVPRIAADTSLRLHQQEGLNVGYLAMNTTKRPFDDVRVRRAINMAIDKAAIIEAVYQGAGVAAKNPVPPILWSHNADVRDYPFDVAQAQRLLREAGYPEGFESDLWYLPVSRPYTPNGKRVAEMIQADLSKVGIRLKLVTDEWSQYRTRIQAGESSMALYGWTGDNSDPDNFLHVLLGCTAARPGGNNVAKWCDPEYDSLVIQAKRVSDQAERERLYKQAQVIFKEQAPWVPLAHSVVFMATRQEVIGFEMDPLGRHIFDHVDLKP
jgi:dipeptide transport system substrate-binding protein